MWSQPPGTIFSQSEVSKNSLEKGKDSHIIPGVIEKTTLCPFTYLFTVCQYRWYSWPGFLNWVKLLWKGTSKYFLRNLLLTTVSYQEQSRKIINMSGRNASSGFSFLLKRWVEDCIQKIGAGTEKISTLIEINQGKLQIIKYVEYCVENNQKTVRILYPKALSIFLF